MDKYSVNCSQCEEEGPATMLEEYIWQCDNCGTTYDEESGRIVNETEKAYYSALYIGAKVAGILNTEPEFQGDKEQMRTERW
jgi:ribosomal protein L37AE/L43A